MTDQYRSQFRLPWALYEELKERADASGRSLNAEVVQRLETSLRTEEFLNKPVSDPAGQAAVYEVMTLIRQVDVNDLVLLLKTTLSLIPDEIIETNPTLKSELKLVRILMRRLAMSSDQANRIRAEYEAKYANALNFVQRSNDEASS